MNITYGDRYFRGQKRLTVFLSDADARRRHLARQLHAVLICHASRPHCVLELSKDYVGVGFLDDYLREMVSYQFTEVSPGKLFLGMATYREFVGESDNVSNATIYSFKQDGNVIIVKHDLINKTTEEGETRIDVTTNWEPYPEFGMYESITRLER